MNIKKHIPNLFTLGNLLCGIIATVYAVVGRFEYVAIFVLIGIILDFFDGFLARILKVSGELGKQLDSLADMVTSGVVPGIVMFTILNNNNFVIESLFSDIVTTTFIETKDNHYLSFLGFLLTISACYRLAKFNIDTRQSDSFIGLPTPAMSLFVVSLPLISMTTNMVFVKAILENQYYLIGVTLVLSYLMNSEIRLLSLKFKNFGVAENKMKYLLMISSIILLITLQYLAVPIIILLYVVLSIIENTLPKKA